MNESIVTVPESGATVPLETFDMLAPLRVTDLHLTELAPRTDPETARAVWREAQARALVRADPLFLGTYIIRTAYRLVREWARTIGVLGYDSALSSLTIDKLIIPMPPGDPPLGPFSMRAYRELRKTYERETPPNKPGPRGLPLLPSTSPHFSEARHDAYSAAMRHLSEFLRLNHCEYSMLALPYLLQTPLNLTNWPDPTLLYAYEGALIDEVLGIILDNGTRNAETWLISENGGGYLPHEARGFVRLAKFECRNRMEAEIEEDRAILSMRLEDLIQRSRDALDMRVELGAIKQLAIVQGVTRAEPEDAMSEFARVVRKVTDQSPKALLEPPDPSPGP
jgi:hypothetical protein